MTEQQLSSLVVAPQIGPSELERIIRKQNTRLRLTECDTGWINYTMASGNWDPYPNEEAPAFRRKDGVVYHKGILRRVPAGGANDAWIFMPIGFRPFSNNVNGHIQVSINTSGGGQVLYFRNDGAVYFPIFNPGAGGFVYLNDIRPYPADA